MFRDPGFKHALQGFGERVRSHSKGPREKFDIIRWLAHHSGRRIRGEEYIERLIMGIVLGIILGALALLLYNILG